MKKILISKLSPSLFQKKLSSLWSKIYGPTKSQKTLNYSDRFDIFED